MGDDMCWCAPERDASRAAPSSSSRLEAEIARRDLRGRSGLRTAARASAPRAGLISSPTSVLLRVKKPECRRSSRALLKGGRSRS